MALQNFQYDIIMREYNRRQSQVQHDLEERRAEAFARVPRLLEIDSEVAALSAQKARSLLQGEPDLSTTLRKMWLRSLLNAVPFLRKTVFPKIILNRITSVRSVRTRDILVVRNAPVLRKLRSNCSIHSPISPRFSKKRTLNTFLLTGILIQ